MENKKIRWGIIGPGNIAKQFAHDFQFSEMAELKAVASNSSQKAKQFAHTFNIPTTYSNYQDLFNDPDIDAIYVATPHVFHFQNSMDALNANKAVLCEKPLTEDLSKTKALVEFSKSENKYLVEGMWTYFLPAIRKAQQWVKDGKLGRVLHIKSDFGFAFPYNKENRKYNPELAGGAVLDMGIYPIAMAWLILQKHPNDINVISHLAPSGVDDDVQMIFNYGSEIATLHTSFRCKLHNWTYIIGEKGYIAIPDFWRAKECFLYENETITEHFTDGRHGNGFNFEIDSVSKDLLLHKKESDIVPHSTSIALMEQMQKVIQLL